ncbi:MAG TPA: 4-(cytidine 5'-diphospho)-2-C-methyl-D-erythritol kinase [bacterium]|nr:4-(cytidine 5'-diphospho)-2-C-methyl-D-erythritol kinase [bacterium]
MSAGRGKTLFLPARAKLNLALRIVGRRADGYHLLDTVFHALALHDDVAVTRTEEGRAIEVRAPREPLLVPADDRNLAVRALAALQRATGDRGGFRVCLYKRIPNGGGLGGGSSDAAAVLRLGNLLLGEPLDQAALTALAGTLGADVAFFLRGGTQRGRGVGEQLEPLPHRRGHFVLVLPPFGCETRAVYKNHAALLAHGGPADTVAPITVPENRDLAVGIGTNELERAAVLLRPELGRLRDRVVQAGYAQVRMTGSGSTLFVACADSGAAEECRRVLQSSVASTDSGGVGFVVTASGPALDGDRPSSQVPATVAPRPPDPLG